jgi:hypothetical protein
MSPPQLSDLEAALGRVLSPADRGSIPNLNEMPEELIAVARRLESRSLVRQLIEYYGGLRCRPYLADFIEKVIIGKESPKLWRRGDILVPAPSLATQLGLKRDVLLAPIGGYHDVRIRPDFDSWKAGTSWIGAPAKARPDADYRSTAPEGTVNVVSAELEQAPDVAITVRRWIASRIARCLVPGERPTIEGLFASVPSLPAVEQWSEDARIAVAALLREFGELPPLEGEIPGFRGPDSWYRVK